MGEEFEAPPGRWESRRWRDAIWVDSNEEALMQGQQHQRETAEGADVVVGAVKTTTAGDVVAGTSPVE